VALDVIIMPPHEFEVPSGWHYWEQGVTMSDFQDIYYGTSSVKKFRNFRPVIPQLQNSYRGMSVAKGVDLVEFG
jgi:hypothetical protein